MLDLIFYINGQLNLEKERKKLKVILSYITINLKDIRIVLKEFTMKMKTIKLKTKVRLIHYILYPALVLFEQDRKARFYTCF